MKSTTRRQNPKSTRTVSTAGKARWLPTENTQPQTFADRRALQSKRACPRQGGVGLMAVRGYAKPADCTSPVACACAMLSPGTGLLPLR